jgi:hypothetical protein
MIRPAVERTKALVQPSGLMVTAEHGQEMAGRTALLGHPLAPSHGLLRPCDLHVHHRAHCATRRGRRLTRRIALAHQSACPTRPAHLAGACVCACAWKPAMLVNASGKIRKDSCAEA